MMQAVDKQDRYFAGSSVKETSFSVWQSIYLPIKRLFDILLSMVLLIVLSPLFLIISILIMLERDGPIFFRQQRVGRNGKIIKINKFRSMSSKAPADIATAEFTDSDIYITKLGKFLRKTSVDELPQFFNVLKGDMSIVGPRPLILKEVDVHSLRMEKGVYAIKPGLTGYAQINGRDLVTPHQKVNYDEYYLHHFGFLLDAKILFRSVIIVLTHRGFIEGHQQTKTYVHPRREKGVETYSNVATIHNSDKPSMKKDKVSSIV